MQGRRCESSEPLQSTHVVPYSKTCPPGSCSCKNTTFQPQALSSALKAPAPVMPQRPSQRGDPAGGPGAPPAKQLQLPAGSTKDTLRQQYGKDEEKGMHSGASLLSSTSGRHLCSAAVARFDVPFPKPVVKLLSCLKLGLSISTLAGEVIHQMQDAARCSPYCNVVWRFLSSQSLWVWQVGAEAASEAVKLASCTEF